MVKRTLHLQNFNTTYSNFRISHVPAPNNFEGSKLRKQIKDKNYKYQDYQPSKVCAEYQLHARIINQGTEHRI